MKDAPGLDMDESETTDHPPKEQPDRGKGEKDMQFALPSAIGDRLKAYYNDVASEPVPDRFVSLLEALDKAESRASEKKQGDKE